jgi:hypothetical protein
MLGNMVVPLQAAAAITVLYQRITNMDDIQNEQPPLVSCPHCNWSFDELLAMNWITPIHGDPPESRVPCQGSLKKVVRQKGG